MTDPMITVRGEARREGPPDLATVSVTVSASGSSAAAVRSDLSRAAAALRTLLEARQAALESWSTAGLTVTPVFRERSRKITGYKGTLSTNAVIKDLDAVGDLVAAVGDVPGAGVDGPWWSLRPDNPLYREARLAAVADARRRAEDYATAVDGTLGAVIEVSDLEPGGFGGTPRRMSWMAQAADEPALELEPPAQEVTGQVTVRFGLVLTG